MAFIYVITNDVNNKQYIGKTNTSIQKRFKEHIADSQRVSCTHRPLYNAMNKYGIEHFHIEELEECSLEDSSAKEQYWINKLDTYHSGYNATIGGDGQPLYDYKDIVNKYLECGYIVDTAKYFKCDKGTVLRGCQLYDIPIKQHYFQEKMQKPVYMLDKNTNQILQTFNSIAEASRFLGIENSDRHIGKVCNGKRKTAYGYKWVYQNRL